MAIAEHEITSQEVTQSITVRLSEAQAATLRQAAATQGQSVEELIVSASAHTAEAILNPASSTPPSARRDPLDSLFRLLEFEPELDALMEHIHEEQRKGIEQFRAEEVAEEAAEQAKAQQ